MFRVTLALFAIGFVHQFSQAGEPEKYRLPPWHLVSTEHYLKEPISGDKFTLNFQSIDDINDDKCTGIFLIPFCGLLNGHLVYFGVGRFSYPVPPVNGKSEQRTLLCGVFSRWGTKDARLARPIKGGMSFGSDHEDDHISVRAAIAIIPGEVSTLMLQISERGFDEAGKPFVWVRALIQGSKAKGAYDIGQLRFPGEKITISYSGSVIERYSSIVDIDNFRKGLKSMKDVKIPRVRFVVGNWAMDSKASPPYMINVQYWERVPQVGKGFVFSQTPAQYCEGLSDTFDTKTSVFLLTDDLVWERPSHMKRVEVKLGPEHKEVAKLIREGEAYSHLTETLYFEKPATPKK